MSLPRELFASAGSGASAAGSGAPAGPGALLLRCTACGGELIYFAEERFLLCPTSRLRFPITEDGIPVMLIEEAARLDEAEVAGLLARAPAPGAGRG